MSTFSTKQYSWAELTIALGGRIVTGVKEVEYTEKVEKEALFGRGAKAHAIMRGNHTFEGKLSLWQSELEALVESAPDKDIMKLNFDIIVSYVPLDGGIIVVDTLTGCEFSELKKGMKQGDTNMVVELPIIFLDVKRQQ
jgi:hypothetical protein